MFFPGKAYLVGRICFYAFQNNGSYKYYEQERYKRNYRGRQRPCGASVLKVCRREYKRHHDFSDDKLAAAEHRIRPTTKPDVDNCAKAILDALNGVCYLDDRQVVDLRVEKYYTGGNPYLEISVGAIE